MQSDMGLVCHLYPGVALHTLKNVIIDPSPKAWASAFPIFIKIQGTHSKNHLVLSYES